MYTHMYVYICIEREREPFAHFCRSQPAGEQHIIIIIIIVIIVITIMVLILIIIVIIILIIIQTQQTYL